MALLAGGREARVIHRCLRRVEVRLMAGNASRHRNVVIAKLRVVAIGAQPRRRRVRTGQGPACRGVVEGRRRPSGGRMALLAGLGERTRHVIWRFCALVVRQMAGHAGRDRDVVITELRVVAIRAGSRRNLMQARQRPSRRCMVEAGWLPSGCGVALFAGLRVSAAHVIRRFRSLEVGQVAGHARSDRDVVVAKLRVVTIDASSRRHRMQSG